MVDKIRSISCNEQLYLDMQDLMNTFAMQFVLEYEGIIDKHKLEDAINFVLRNTNDSNLMLFNKCWYKSNENIKVKFIDISSEDVFEDDFFKEKIDYRSHSLEVYLLKHYDKRYIVFKLLHSVSDGKGALLLVENIFKKLKDEELLKCTNSFNEQDLVKDIAIHDKKINLIPKFKFKGNVNIIKKYTPSWGVFSIDGYHSGIIAKIASALSKHFENDSVNFMIPVDIRRHLDKYQLGNMTLPIFLSASKNETWEEINGRLLYALKNKEELNKKSIEYFGYKNIPKFFRNIVVNFIKRYFNIKKLYMNGSIISYLGRVDVKNFSNEMFKIVDFISLPVQSPFEPFSISIVETNNKMNIAISRYKEQIDCHKFDEITRDIREKF